MLRHTRGPWSSAWIVPLACTLGLGCTSSAPPPDTRVALGGEVVARVGDARIPKALVEQVARAKGVTPRAALDLLIEDALLAQHAKAEGAPARPDVKWKTRTVLARATTRRVREAAAPDAAPTDAEVERLTALHYWELGRGPARQVVHALVMRREKKPFDEEGALQLAQTILAATTSVSNEGFEKAAAAVPAGTWTVKVEHLPPILDDGRTPIPGQNMVPEFAAGTFAIPAKGDTRVVETSFGWHVVRLVEVLPPVSVPLEDRREALASEAYRDRGKELLDAALERLRRATPPRIEGSAASLMASVVAEGAPR